MNNRVIKSLALVSLLSLHNAAMAVPANPRPFVWTQPDGTQLSVRLVGDEFFSFYLTEDGQRCQKDADGWLRPYEEETFKDKSEKGGKMRFLANKAHKKTAFPAKGKQKVLVVLLEFPDNKFVTPDAANVYKRMMNEEGFSDYGATGSCHDYFYDSSNGLFDPQFDVYGPLMLSQKEAYYGAESYIGHDSNPQKLPIEACQMLDDIVDFNDYDTDNDGVIDNVYIFYAGRGQASGGSDDTIWPHSADVTDFNERHYFDGVLLNHYACSNEIDESNTLAGIGTFCHEFSHVLGLPDLYSTSYTGAFTTGPWSIMDYGPYNNEGHTPPLYSCYERMAMGWLNPIEMGNQPLTARIKPIADNEAYILRTDDPDEYYMFENRQLTGWDTYLPGHGMLVWHIDYYEPSWQLNTVNNNGEHQRIDIIEADNTRDEKTRDGDIFPGAANVTSITDDTAPNLIPWSGIPQGWAVTDIREIDGEVFFEFQGGNPPLQFPTPLTAVDVKPQSFVVKWNDVADADNYLVTVATVGEDGKAADVVYGFDKKDVGYANECLIEGLNYDTDYIVNVQAKNRYYTSLKGDGIIVKTAPATFDLLKPELYEPSDITDNGFKASWKYMRQAKAFEVKVYQKSFGEAQRLTVDFADSKIPDNWNTNTDGFYTTTAYSGVSSPSLQMNDEGEYIESCVLEEDIRKFSFWHRSTAKTTDNVLMVQLMDKNGEWNTIDTMAVERVSGGTVKEYGEQTDCPIGYINARALRLVFNQTSKGDLAIDDIIIEYGGEVEETNGKTISVDAVADADQSAFLSGLNEGETYFCKVRGIDGNGTYSDWSDEVIVVPGTSSAIFNLQTTGMEEEKFYDLSGREILNPQKGIYITNHGKKVIVK